VSPSGAFSPIGGKFKELKFSRYQSHVARNQMH